MVPTKYPSSNLIAFGYPYGIASGDARPSSNVLPAIDGDPPLGLAKTTVGIAVPDLVEKINAYRKATGYSIETRKLYGAYQVPF